MFRQIQIVKDYGICSHTAAKDAWWRLIDELIRMGYRKTPVTSRKGSTMSATWTRKGQVKNV